MALTPFNLCSDKEIIMEERSKEEIMEEGEPSQYMDEEEFEEKHDEEDQNVQKSEDFNDEMSEKQRFSMFQDASNDQCDGNAEIEIFENDSEDEFVDEEPKGGKDDCGVFPVNDAQPVIVDKVKDSEMSKMVSTGSLTGNQNFDSFSDTIAQENQRLYRNELLTKDILGEVADEDEIEVHAKVQGHNLESAPVSIPIPSMQKKDASYSSKKVGFDCGNSGSEKPLLSASTKLSDKETLPFSNNDLLSPSKNISEVPTTKGQTTDLTDISPGKAIDTSDEELGTLHSDATGNKPVYYTSPEASPGGKNFNPKKKFVIDGTLPETVESLENLISADSGSRVVDRSKEKNDSEKGDETLKSHRLDKSKTVSNETISLNSSDAANKEKDSPQHHPSMSNEGPKVTASQSTSLNNFSILPDRPGRLTLSSKTAPQLKRSESPIKEDTDTGPMTHRSHSKTTAVSVANGTLENSTPLNVYENDGEKKSNPLVQLKAEKDGSTRSSRRGSFDSFSSESMFPIVPQDQDQQSSNFSHARDSSHGTPVHMIGVRASPSMDPLYQLLDRISRKGENLKNMADMQNKVQQDSKDEDNSKLDAMNGIITNLESQIELLGSENERLKSEIVRINLVAESSSQPKVEGHDQSIHQQVDFLDKELDKYRSENSELKKELDELRKNLFDQEKSLNRLNRAASYKKSHLSSSYSKNPNPLEPLIEGSHESLERSFSSPKRTPRASLADDVVAAKEAEIARLSVELEEVMNDNNHVVGELERVKALFTRSQINELKENIDREMERAEKGESEHPQQTLQELAATIQRLEESVASQNDSHSLHKSLMSQIEARSKNRDAASVEATTARIKRKLNSDSLPRTYTGRIDQRSLDTEPSGSPIYKSSEEIYYKSSFAPVEQQSREGKNKTEGTGHPRERPFSGPPHPSKQQNFHPIKPVPVVDAHPSAKTSPDFKTSTISLPAEFSAVSSPTRTLSRESLRHSAQGSDAQVQTNLSVGNQFEPHKMSMSTQTEFNVMKAERDETKASSGYNYGPDLVGKMPPVAFPNMGVQTNNQVEEAIENLSYDTLRSYTRNLSIDAIHGVVYPEVPVPFANPKSDDRFLIESSTPHELGSTKTFRYPSGHQTNYYNDGVVFRDTNVASQTYSEPMHRRTSNEAQNFGSFPADRHTMRSEFLQQPSSMNNHCNHSSIGFGTNIGGFGQPDRKPEWPPGLHGVVLDMIHEEVARVKEEEKRKTNLILNELTLKSSSPMLTEMTLRASSSPHSNYFQSSFASPQPEVTFVPPIETLIMNKYKSDESWKIPPSNIGELLQYSFHGKAPVDRSFRDYEFGPTQSGFDAKFDFVPTRSGNTNSVNLRNLGCKTRNTNNHEHVSDSYERSTHSLCPREHHREIIGGSNSPELISTSKKSSLSPYEFLNSVSSSVGVRRSHSTKRF